MAVRESGDSLVLVFGEPGGLAEPVAAAMRRDGILVAHEHPPGIAPPGRGQPADHGRTEISSGGPSRPIESAIVIIDALATEALFAGGDRASRRHCKVWENDVCEIAVTTVVGRGAGMVLLACDARTLALGRRVRTQRWLRHAAHRIAYESAINGVHGLVTAYGVVGTERDVDRLADGVVAWLGTAGSHARATRSVPSRPSARGGGHRPGRRRRRSGAAHRCGAGTLRAA